MSGSTIKSNHYNKTLVMSYRDYYKKHASPEQWEHFKKVMRADRGFDNRVESCSFRDHDFKWSLR